MTNYKIKDEVLELQTTRSMDTMNSIFVSNNPEQLILTSSTDTGVIRNGGRRGSYLGPKSILNFLGRMSKSDKKTWSKIEVSNPILEFENFELAQKNEANKILQAIDLKLSRYVHIGGGHDHIFPLLSALANFHSNIAVINIDAHLDTRTDHLSHSGNPFRQFSNQFKGNFLLYQFGTQEFANGQSNYSKLKSPHEMHLAKPVQLKSILEELKENNYFVVLSLDADAINGAFMPGVSAPNPQGFSQTEVKNLIDQYQTNSSSQLLAIYELNPIFDTTNSLSARTIASFIYDFLK